MSIIRSAALVRAKIFEISVLCEEVHRIAEDGRYAAAVAIGVDEGRSVEAIASGPSDLEAGVGFLEGDGFRVAVAGEAGGEVIGGVEEGSEAMLVSYTRVFMIQNSASLVARLRAGLLRNILQATAGS